MYWAAKKLWDVPQVSHVQKDTDTRIPLSRNEAKQQEFAKWRASEQALTKAGIQIQAQRAMRSAAEVFDSLHQLALLFVKYFDRVEDKDWPT